MAAPRYSIDSSSLIHGWREAYSPENFEGLWTRMGKLADGGIVIASQEVLGDLKKKDDEVYQWCLNHAGMFIEVDDAQQTHLSFIMRKYPKFVDTRKGRNASDPFIIALALSYEPHLTVVTQETAGGSIQRPKIPLVCGQEDVPCQNLAQLVRQEGWKFRL